MRTSNCIVNRAALCFVGLLAAASLDTAAQTPGTLTYSAEIEISKERLLTVEQYELAKPMLPTQYQAQAEFYINLVRTGHQYEYKASLWADLGFGSSTRATNVHLTFPNGQIRVGKLNADNDLVFPDWTNRVYSFAELKAALPPGTYQLAASFREGAGTNYTATLPDYTEDSFPWFIPGVLTWTGASNAPLVLQWDTIPDVDEYEISANIFPIGPEVYETGNIFPTHLSDLPEHGYERGIWLRDGDEPLQRLHSGRARRCPWGIPSRVQFLHSFLLSPSEARETEPGHRWPLPVRRVGRQWHELPDSRLNELGPLDTPECRHGSQQRMLPLY